jgi:hypothetical protein
MKKLILLLFFAGLITLTGLAQEKITRYCFLKPVISGFSSEMTTVKKVYIDYGTQSSTTGYKDSTVIKNIEAVKDLKSYADITNYMESIGWTFVPGSGSMIGGTGIIFTFKREFDKSEMVDKVTNKP